jgi:heterodisulfide reductase subunit A-like polyferredoxin
MEGSVLVIGGGIAGIQVSLDLTELGFKVHLVEKEAYIGGHMAQFDKLFPSNDCSLCVLAPKMIAIYRNPNINLYTLSEVKTVSGKAGDFNVIIQKNPRFVNEARCKGCGDCAAKCPKVEAPNLFDMNLGKRKSIYIPFPQAIPPVYMIDPKLCLYLNRNVCRVCEKVCKNEAIDFEQKPKDIEFSVGAIVIATGYEMLGQRLSSKWGYQYKNVVNALEYERILSPTGPFGNQILRPSDETEPKSIAFIQCAGSSYLGDDIPYCSRACCMYTTKDAVLTKMYAQDSQVSIFRHNIRVFGKNFYEYTKKAQLDYGINYFNSNINSIEELPSSHDIIVKYDDLRTRELGKSYIANLVVLAAPLVPSRGTKELAEIMGINVDKFGFFQDSSYFDKSLSTKDGVYLCGFCQGPMVIAETVSNASGVASQISTFLSPARYTQIVDKEIESKPEEELIKIIPRTLIIGGGISGMTAAINIGNQGFETILVERENKLGGNLTHLNLIYPTQQKASKFMEEKIELVSNNEKIRVFLNSSIEKLEGSLGNYHVKICSQEKEINFDVGTIIVATGSKEFKPQGLFQYNEENKQVITQLELEERLKEGKRDMLDKIEHITIIMCVNARQKGGYSYCSNICCSNTIKNINILKKLKPELKIIVLFRELHMAKKEFEQYVSKRKKIADYLKYDLTNIPHIAKINDNPEKYEIKVPSITNKKEIITFETDLVILSTPMIPPEDIPDLASKLKVNIDDNGFFIEAHKKLRPLDLSSHGIFICGCAQWPKNVQDSILEANAAAGRASRFLNLHEISTTKLEMLSVFLSIECFFKDMIVNIEKCNGCGQCADVCQFKAITLVDLKQEYEDVSISTKKAYINPAICKGCGRCSTVCRLKAIDPLHYDFKQITSLVEPYFIDKSKKNVSEEYMYAE